MIVATGLHSRPKPGEVENGDRAIVHHSADSVLLAVIDGLGHGPKAARAADLAAECLSEWEHGHSAPELVELLHRGLRGTRGAAAMVCTLRGFELSGCGVGNVELHSVGTRVPTVLSAGVLGHRMRVTRGFACRLEPGDRLILNTDGVSRRFMERDYKKLTPQSTSDHIIAEFGRESDDATILVADLKEK